MNKLFSFLKEENYQVILHEKGLFSALKGAQIKSFDLKDIELYFLQDNIAFFIESFDKKKNLIFTQGKWNYFTLSVKKSSFSFFVQNITHHPSKEAWEDICTHTILNLNDQFPKVILSSRISFHTLNHPLEIFLALIEKYTNQQTFFIQIEDSIWIGSTPETLLKVQDKKCESMALAGTFSSLPQNIDKKTSQEHNIVSSFISSSFHKHCDSFQKGNSFYMELPSLYHLCTPFLGEIMPSQIYPLLEELHPTPALCGFPKERALSWIQQKESSPRKFYGGFFGTIGNHTLKSFVTIRCLEYFQEFCTLYIGAGIVKQSQPQEEWKELMKKADTFHFLWEFYAKNT